MENLQNQTTAQEPVKNKEIRLSELSAYVQEGKKKEDIMRIYGLNSAQVGRLMKEAKLTFRKFHKPAFTLIQDVEVQSQPVYTEEEPIANTPEPVAQNIATDSQPVAEDNWM